MNVAPGRFTWLAFSVSVLTLLGSLWLSMGMGLKACPLCYYQRTFVMAVVAVLGIALLARIRSSAPLTLPAIPLAAGGLGVAVFHVWLEAVGTLECPGGMFGVGSAPQQALVAQALLFVALVADCGFYRKLAGPSIWSKLLGGVVMGAVLAYAGVKSAPPLPPKPTTPYETVADVCRPAYSAE